MYDKSECMEALDIGLDETDPVVAGDYILSLLDARYLTDKSQHEPMVFIFHRGQVLTMVQLDFDDDWSKAISISETKRIAKKMSADCTVFVSEAWMLEQPSPDFAVRPSESERRIEVLIVEVSSPQRTITILREFRRDWSGNLQGFTERSRMDSDDKDGDISIKSRFDFLN